MSHEVNEENKLRVVEVPDAEYGQKFELRGANNMLFGIFIFRHNADEWFDKIKSHSEAYAAEKVKSSCNGCGSDTTYCSNCERLLQS